LGFSPLATKNDANGDPMAPMVMVMDVMATMEHPVAIGEVTYLVYLLLQELHLSSHRLNALIQTDNIAWRLACRVCVLH
jgi:hypothetical protein